MSNPNNQKFRPYFTPSELSEVIRCLKAAPTTSLPLLRYLESFSLKITHGIISPQVTLQPSIADKLGMSTAVIQESIETLHERWKQDPQTITPPEMQRIQQYRWEYDLMNAEEAAAYEESILSGKGN